LLQIAVIVCVDAFLILSIGNNADQYSLVASNIRACWPFLTILSEGCLHLLNNVFYEVRFWFCCRTCTPRSHCAQISLEEFDQERAVTTSEALAALQASAEYQLHVRCRSMPAQLVENMNWQARRSSLHGKARW
jgi:hypothetical protein